MINGGYSVNILICSVGRRVQLINYFKKELNKIDGKVIAVDCDQTAPALYHADIYEIVPRIDHPEYIQYIKSICHKYNIKGVLSLIDPELSLLTRYKEEFKKEDIQIIISDKKVVDICYDKYLTYQFLQEHNLPAVPTYIDINEVIEELNIGNLCFPLIVKLKNGSGSNGIHKVANRLELESLLIPNHDYIVQPFMQGSEYCVECYIDLISRKTTSFFSKRKLNMRAGETDKSVVVKDPVLHQLTKKLITKLGLVGPVDIDFFKMEEGYVISEINPRFGGGYPYAYEMGQNFIKDIINNLNEFSNEPYVNYIGEYEEGKTMVRYDQFVVL